MNIITICNQNFNRGFISLTKPICPRPLINIVSYALQVINFRKKTKYAGHEKLKIDKINDVMDVFVEMIEINP